MDAATDLDSPSTREQYKSRPGALIWFFKKGRDNWKAKYQLLKASVDGLKKQLTAVTNSRAEWRAKAEAAARHVETLEAELREARDCAAAAVLQKKVPAKAR